MNKIFLVGLIFFQQLCFATYYSQCGQDRFVYEKYFQNNQGGVFVDIGAHNGIKYSNTYFLEKEKGWKGICIEPIPERFAELQSCRDCVCIQGCISDIEGISQLLMVSSPVVDTEMLSGLLHKYDNRHLERVKREIIRNGGSYQLIDVQCYILNDLLENNGIAHVDFLSIDTEGGEFDIISSIDFARFRIDVITVEDNYRDPRFIPYLTEKGYTYVTHLDQDLIFVRNDIQR